MIDFNKRVYNKIYKNENLALRHWTKAKNQFCFTNQEQSKQCFGFVIPIEYFRINWLLILKLT